MKTFITAVLLSLSLLAGVSAQACGNNDTAVSYEAYDNES